MKKILIVDSDASTRNQIKWALCQDFHVLEAEDEREGLQALNHHTPDLVLLDINLPNSKGFELFNHLKNNPSTKNTPIIFLTDFTKQTSQTLEFIESNDYIVKPFINKDLLLRVKKHLSFNATTLLIIDPCEEIRKQIKYTLETDHFTVLEANDIQEAFQKMTSSPPNIILLDAGLPDITKADINKLKNHSKSKNTPILYMVSDNNSLDQDILALESDDFIIKPVLEKELRYRLKKYTSLSLKTILVIDNELQTLETAQKSLQREGFYVFTASNKDQALSIIQTEKPNIIVLDVGLPNYNSEALFQALWQDNDLKAIPIIFMATPQQLDEHKDLLMRANDYLIKPLNEKSLLLRTKKLFTHPQPKKVTTPQIIQGNNIDTNIVKASTPPPAPEPQPLNPISPEDPIIHEEKTKLLQQLKVTLNHEIRNPLTSILIGSQALNGKFPEGSDERKILKEVVNNSKRIKEILDTLENVKEFVEDDYMNGIKMINLDKSLEKSHLSKRQ